MKKKTGKVECLVCSKAVPINKAVLVVKDAEEPDPGGEPVAGAHLGEVGEVVLGGEDRVAHGRPHLRDADPDQRLVEALAGDAGVVTDVEVPVGVLEGDRDRLLDVGRQVDELLVGRVRCAHGC